MKAKRSKRCDWTFIVDGGRAIQCNRCNVRHFIQLPIAISKYAKIIDAFNCLHLDCTEPPAVAPGSST